MYMLLYQRLPHVPKVGDQYPMLSQCNRSHPHILEYKRKIDFGFFFPKCILSTALPLVAPLWMFSRFRKIS